MLYSTVMKDCEQDVKGHAAMWTTYIMSAVDWYWQVFVSYVINTPTLSGFFLYVEINFWC